MSHISIKPLTPDLAADYFDFFENRAFTDDSPYRCYCQVYQMSREQYNAAFDGITDGAELGRTSREVAERQIASGVLRGYLAFADGAAIGWCNANDKANYPAEPYYDNARLFHAPAEKHEKAVICFEIAPEFRGKGVATALLERVCADAKAEGYTAVEGFPTVRVERYEWDFSGPVRLYEKVGFVEVGRLDGRVVMRKMLERKIEDDIREALSEDVQTNALAFAAAGLAVVRMAEETDKATLERECEFSGEYYAPCKAKKFPLSMVMKARKL